MGGIIANVERTGGRPRPTTSKAKKTVCNTKEKTGTWREHEKSRKKKEGTYRLGGEVREITVRDSKAKTGGELYFDAKEEELQRKNA